MSATAIHLPSATSCSPTPHQIPPEIHDLLMKYRAHRVPAINELVDRRSIELIHSGFTHTHGASLAIYWPVGDPNEDSSWVADDATGRVVRSPTVVPLGGNGQSCKRCHDWDQCCGRVQCDTTDVRFASETARRREGLTYSCDTGLLYVTYPIILENQVIAVLFTGQLFPARDPQWRTTKIEHLDPGDSTRDLHELCLERLRASDHPLGTVSAMKDPSHFPQVRPADLNRYRAALEITGDALLRMAQTKAELEKSELRCFFRRWLYELPREPRSLWPSIGDWLRAWCFPEDAFFLGITYTADAARVNVDLALSIPHLKLGEHEIGDRAAWAGIRKALRGTRQMETFGVSGLLNDFRLPSARVVAFPLRTRGFLLYGVRSQSGGPSMWQSEYESGLQYAQDFGILLEDMEITRGREEFLASFSHELRSPIHSAGFTIGRLRKGRVTDSHLFDLRCRRLQAQLYRQLKLIEGVWQLQTILAGQNPKYTMQRINVYDFIVRCVSQASDLSESEDLNLKIVSDRKSLAELPAVELDKDAFELVVFNLLDNAVKYSHENTEIRVFGERRGLDVVLTFTNLGIPLPNQRELDVFARFTRTLEAVCVSPTGSGLGLFLVRHIVEGHNGRIEASSSRRDSSRHLVKFEVFLPIKQESF